MSIGFDNVKSGRQNWVKVQTGRDCHLNLKSIYERTGQKFFNSLRLFYNGERLNPNSLAKDVPFSDGDEVQVYTEIRGGGKKNLHRNKRVLSNAQIMEELEKEQMLNSKNSSKSKKSARSLCPPKLTFFDDAEFREKQITDKLIQKSARSLCPPSLTFFDDTEFHEKHVTDNTILPSRSPSKKVSALKKSTSAEDTSKLNSKKVTTRKMRNWGVDMSFTTNNTVIKDGNYKNSKEMFDESIRDFNKGANYNDKSSESNIRADVVPSEKMDENLLELDINPTCVNDAERVLSSSSRQEQTPCIAIDGHSDVEAGDHNRSGREETCNDAFPNNDVDEVFDELTVTNSSSSVNLTKSHEVVSTDSDDTEWLSILRSDYAKGLLSKNNPCDRRLIFYLELKEIAAAEIPIMKNMYIMRQKLIEYETQKSELTDILNKVANQSDTTDANNQNLRINKKAVENSNQVTPIKEDHNGIKKSLRNGNAGIRSEIEPDVTCFPQTPIERSYLKKLFGIQTPSPLTKHFIVEDKDCRRISLAVHLYTELEHGGVDYLHKNRVTDDDFRSILVLTGPDSKWRLLKGYSVLQMKTIWRNLTKSDNPLNGDKATGFENKDRLHDATELHCPFGHCKKGLFAPFFLDLYESKQVNVQNCFPQSSGSLVVRKLFDEHKEVVVDVDGSASNNIIDDNSEFDMDLPTNVRSDIFIQGEGEEDSDDSDAPIIIEEDLSDTLKSKLIKLKEDLLQEIELKKKKKLVDENETQDDKESVPLNKVRLHCDVVGCRGVYSTPFALMGHQKRIHGVVSYVNTECMICGVSVKYIIQHLKEVHGQRNNFCEVCQQNVPGSMKVHSGLCTSCPKCFQEFFSRKGQLLKHIRNNECSTRPKDKMPISKSVKYTTSRLNVTETDKVRIGSESAGKVVAAEIIHSLLDNLTITCGEETQSEDISGGMTDIDDTQPEETLSGMSEEDIEEHEDMYNKLRRRTVKGLKESNDYRLNGKRSGFSFNISDDSDSDGGYVSEYEDGDSSDYSELRRKGKDSLQLELLDIDKLSSPDTDPVVEQFRNYLIEKKNHKMSSTISIYTSVIEHKVLPAMRRRIDPFDSSMIFDCTPKYLKINGKPRNCNPTEPVYNSAGILDEIMKEYDGNCGNQTTHILAAFSEWLDFIELEFYKASDYVGTDQAEKVIMHHALVRKYISGTGLWSKCKESKKMSYIKNKIIEKYKNPNKEAEILENNEKYIRSDNRIQNISKVLKTAANEDMEISAKEFTEITNIVMGEVIASTGCRPVVLRKLPMGSYADKGMGFDPREVSPGDCKVTEAQGNDRIYSRLDPNLPPRHKMCVHQKESRSAECPFQCENMCKPQGWNVLVTWDKNSGSRGSSYLHLINPVKVLIDLYLVIRARYFKNRIDKTKSSKDWLNDDTTLLFMNSKCKMIESVNLKHISKAMGINISSYAFRKIFSTWAQSHSDARIREAEEEVLQHSIKVAREHYKQNRQLIPQLVTATFAEEEDLFPEHIRNLISDCEKDQFATLRSMDKNLRGKRLNALVEEKENHKKLLADRRPLGKKNRVYSTDRDSFKVLLEELSGKSIKSLLDMRFKDWRQFVVRAVCSAQSSDIRVIWKNVYKGDLKFGVREDRLKLKKSNINRKNASRMLDRNSCIAYALFMSLKASEKS